MRCEGQPNESRTEAATFEFELREREFGEIRGLIRQRTGIELSEAKADLVYARLARRLRALGLRDFREYVRLLNCGDAQESIAFVNALTTNVTAFLREPHQYDYLANVAIPEMRRMSARGRPIRIWSAGCASGPEPYSIAMVLQETLPATERSRARILATDLDSDVLAIAREGIYDEKQIERISDARRRRWFRKGRGHMAGRAQVNDALRDMVAFRQLNLIEPWPVRGPLDAIFCCNVLIYHTREGGRDILERFSRLLDCGGYLFLGHAESLPTDSGFHYCDRNTYRKLP